MSWNRLSFHEREVIEKMRLSGKNQIEISQVLGRHPSTISRELAINSVSRKVYDSNYAQVTHDERTHKPIIRPVTENAAHITFVKKIFENFLQMSFPEGQLLRKTRYGFLRNLFTE